MRGCIVVTVVVAVFALPSSAWATDFTWSGGSSVSPFWSNAANWVGGVAPSGSVGTLRFPRLAGTQGCGIKGEPCYTPVDDINGLSANAISFDLGADYVFGYTMPLRTLTLRSGGLSASGGGQLLDFPIPIALAAPQTWSIQGPHGGLSVPSVTGGGVPLAVAFSGGSRTLKPRLEFKTGAETGPFTGTGDGTIVLDDQASLNGSDGSAVSLAQGTELDVIARSSTGPLASSGGLVDIGSGGGPAPGGTLTIGGSINLDAKSEVGLGIVRAGTTPGKDYAQIRARGAVGLGGAYLDLSGGRNQTRCPKLKRGGVETLITATGSITGKFHNVPNGATIALLCESGAPPTVRIHYSAHRVTATVRRG